MRIIGMTGLLLSAGLATASVHAESGMAEPYKIHVSDETLRDLKERLRHTRFPDQIAGSGWDYGTDTQYLKELVAYWANDFDWRKQEKRLNQLHQYRAEIDGLHIHFIHERGKGPNPIPVLMLHGWPSSISTGMGWGPLPRS